MWAFGGTGPDVSEVPLCHSIVHQPVTSLCCPTCSVVWLNHLLSIHSSAGGHGVVCTWLFTQTRSLALVNNTAVNLPVQVFVRTDVVNLLGYIYPRVELLGPRGRSRLALQGTARPRRGSGTFLHSL